MSNKMDYKISAYYHDFLYYKWGRLNRLHGSWHFETAKVVDWAQKFFDKYGINNDGQIYS